VEPYGDQPKEFGKILPVYPLAGQLTQHRLRNAIGQAVLAYGQYVDDQLPPWLVRQEQLLCKAEAVANLHFPASHDLAARAHKTLAIEELYFLQLAVARRAAERTGQARDPLPASTALREDAVRRLPFDLTADQRRALDEIAADLTSPRPMARLLQGDVGSGKTLVALLAALSPIEHGRQAAFMAPTELLARQHAETAARLLEPLGVRVGLLTGNSPNRQELIAALSRGDVQLVVGTHALFTEHVVFADLRLVIVDEQHRFGVAQRISLVSKGAAADVLLMTATPIPRTLALTLFGDLDVSTIRTMPAGRSPVKTHLARHGNEQKVYEFVRKEVAAGRQAYFVYPLIEASEKLALKNAVSMVEELGTRHLAGLRLGLIHSRTPPDKKNETMRAFVAGELPVLVSTSVVEVGVDVPNASCMVVEHAERFGLSGLHQLRGRVGRGAHQSYAFLVYTEPLTDEAKDRLRVMMETTDGFRIAEEDLRIRGPGEILGIEQSGYFRLRFADLARDTELLTTARKAAFQTVHDDPGLLAAEHRRVREVLQRAPPFQAALLDGG
jgi:ATP-dependent DNA helicase RecG